MARKKRAWNDSNPLYRYLKAKRSGKVKAKRKKSTGVGTMARRRKSYSRSNKGGMGGLMPYLFGAGIGVFGKGIAGNLPLVNQLPPIAQTPLLAFGAGKLLRKDPMKMAIGALAASFIFGGANSGAASSSSGVTMY